MRIYRVRVEEKEEFLVYTVLWTLTCHPYLESATALSDIANSRANSLVWGSLRLAPIICSYIKHLFSMGYLSALLSYLRSIHMKKNI